MASAPETEKDRRLDDVDLDVKEPATPDERVEHHGALRKSPEQRKAELEAALVVDPGVAKWSWPAIQVRCGWPAAIGPRGLMCVGAAVHDRSRGVLLLGR